ncbi:MAG: hypothetical protein HDR09_12850 [Lachnospiraceae bacterium]|nr:hypothetical protein [Lachnospiraceae bacterium]
MAKILEFPKQVQKMSPGYHNLTRLIDIVDGIAELQFYAESAVVGEEDGKFLPGEYEKLGEQIRKKCRELTEPKKMLQQEVTGPGLYIYCPEMGESRPECQMIARMSYSGNHYYIDTPLTLKGQGIKFLEVRESKNLTASGQFLTGWNRYKVTERAFKKLQDQYSISMEDHFD